MMKPVEILKDLQKFPDKKFGQNFLVDEKALTDIVAAAKLESEETVVEIGPGLGVLTFALLEKVKRVIAVEADRELADYLREKHIPKLTVVTGDALRVDWTLEISAGYKIVANIPYSITSPLLQKIYHLAKKPKTVILLVQKELAERLTAKPGDRDRGFMTVLSEANADIKIIRKVAPGSFRPMPKVESAVIEVTPFKESKLESVFWPVVEAGFRHARQTLMNGLKDLPVSRTEIQAIFTELKLNPLARPADLSFRQWQQLSQEVGKNIQKS
ncbi:MAG TPA: 16S rRNA (adenine(1518)-N(6)/adenine(1519)-N(6))-dimethyltransferase RsmA [Candidatus Saccharimonadales bacterium]|nr:16S rRNA (adenine(1518)-N(6)/adenine(1519)-N(6))-dimethyltransferase RsmA [Candidatus Saccharimonadales bacterium]